MPYEIMLGKMQAFLRAGVHALAALSALRGAGDLPAGEGRRAGPFTGHAGDPVETIEEKYRCVQAQGISVEQVCREAEVSRSSYYSWLKHKPSERGRRNQALRRRLVELRYPAMELDSLYHLLKPEFGCSRKRVHRQMRLAGISPARRRAYKATTNSNHSHPIAPNLLMRNFTFQRPDQAWVGDITYMPTGEGWLYLAIVKDLCTWYKIPQEDCGLRILRADRHAAGACGPGNGIPPPQAWVGFLSLVSRRNYATPLPNHW